MNRRKTKVSEVPHSWMRFLAGMAVLMFCLSLFCSNAGAADAPYAINAVDTNDVYGIGDEGIDLDLDLPASGWYFGSVRATATTGDNAFAIFCDGEGNNITITGAFGASGLISASAAGSYAFGLSCWQGWVDTNDISGTISGTAGQDRAYGIFAADGITTDAIDGNIVATAGGDYAYGLRSWDTITTGLINGTITADANGSEAYGLKSDSELTIDGNIGSGANISAITRNYSGAYGLYAGSSGSDLTINGDIDGTITADANRYDAYALYAYDDINIVGNINGTIRATAGYTWASGLESDNGSIYTGAIDGNIIATAGHSKAYGLRTWNGSITTGAIGGNIVATADHDDAYGLRSGSDLTVNGGIGGTITADANRSDAYALYADSDLTVNGDITGTISANATTGSGAYALSADGDVNIVGDIGRTAHITATAGEDEAFGLASWYGTLTVGAIDGNIVATAGGDYARGLFSWGDLTTGAINGNIDVNAGGEGAAGLWAAGDYPGSTLTTGDINGVITAYARDGWVRGLVGAGSIVTGAINGTISATSGEGDAIGLYSMWGSITTGAINGTIIADANENYAYGLHANGDINVVGGIGSTARISATTRNGSYAYGLYADPDGYANLTIHGDIDGTITANANEDEAYGLYADGDVNIIGNINGTITATAGDDYAYGLFSYWGNVTVGDVNGTITATAGGDRARGIFGWESITTGDITGTITATAGGDEAAGLFSGGDLTTGDVNGTITATAEGNKARGLFAGDDIITGNINGTITATAGGSEAAGLYTPNGSITTGAINGAIRATAANGSTSAYGLYGYYGITTGAINGTIAAEMTDGSYAYAMYSPNGDINVGDIGSTARLTGTAGDNFAHGLYNSNGSIYTGDINGRITATAGESFACNVTSWSGSINTGAINGTLSATARDSYAYGLSTWSSNGDITTGEINGTITADATSGSYAYGMYSNNADINIVGNIGSTARITATARQDYAYGLYANYSIYTGDIDGTIRATAGDSDAYGLYSSSGDSIHTGNINGTISATAITGYDAFALCSDGDINVGDIGSTARITATARDGEWDDWLDDSYLGAAGLFSYGSITTGDIDGTITAEVTDGSGAYALYAWSDLTTGDIGSNARITATAEGSDAAGLYSWSGSLTTGAIDGVITAEATDGSDGYALFSWLDLTTGDIGSNARITATVDYKGAAGLFSQHGSLTTGDIDGTISATAGYRYAYGLYSDANLTTGTIRGAISAHADGDYAYGIWSHGPMNVTIGSNTDGGNVSATADDGTHVAAIKSGAFDDSVTIKAGSTIVGDIDLASTTDNDTLTLSGLNTRSTTLNDNILNVETINITGGRWNINGNVLDSLNGIALNGGVLGGTGNLGDLNVGNGTLAPGGSIGTMTVGSLTLGPLSTFVAEVANDETADKVIVTGAANLDGTIQGKVYGGLIDHAFAAKVIDAATGLTGTFSTVDTAFLNYSVTYDTINYDVILNVEPTLGELDFAEPAVTKNEHSVGNALNDLVLSGEAGDVLGTIQNLPDDAAVNNAYDQMMPQDALGQSEIIRNAMNQYSESVFGRMDNVRNSGQYAMSADSRYLLAGAGNSVALPPATDKWMPFAKGFGSWGDRDAKSDIAGYQYNIYGMAGGIDKLVSDNTLIGLSVAGSRANVDYSQSGTSSDIDSMLCSVYGAYFVDDWHLGLTLGYGHSWYDSQRGIPFMGSRAESDHQGNSYSAAVELGNNFGGTSMILEPVVGIGYTAVQESGYKEKGAGALNLKVDSDTADGIYSKLGIRVAKELKNPDMTLVPNLSMFWIHDYADSVDLSSSFVGGGSFTTEGREPVRDMFNVGAGLNIYFNKSLRLFVDYGWQSASSFNSNTVQLGAQWSF